MSTPNFPPLAELERNLETIRQSPKDAGALQWIVRRPQVDEREILKEGQLDPADGLVGDSWRARKSPGEEEAAHNNRQITLMNARVISLLAQNQERWQLAGDQLFVDLDLSLDNLPPGAHLKIGAAVIEVTAQPHTGCKKFAERFGLDALKFVNSPVGRQMNLRGINAKVIHPGMIHVGDVIEKMD
jgi:MOSC domain-containing protein YiiM